MIFSIQPVSDNSAQRHADGDFQAQGTQFAQLVSSCLAIKRSAGDFVIFCTKSSRLQALPSAMGR